MTEIFVGQTTLFSRRWAQDILDQIYSTEYFNALCMHSSSKHISSQLIKTRGTSVLIRTVSVLQLDQILV